MSHPHRSLSRNPMVSVPRACVRARARAHAWLVRAFEKRGLLTPVVDSVAQEVQVVRHVPVCPTRSRHVPVVVACTNVKGIRQKPAARVAKRLVRVGARLPDAAEAHVDVLVEVREERRRVRRRRVRHRAVRRVHEGVRPKHDGVVRKVAVVAAAGLGAVTAVIPPIICQLGIGVWLRCV